MSKPSRRTFICPNGHAFEANVFRSANVTAEPHLKETILSGRFNRVRCGSCSAEIDANVPFLYHDVTASQMIWVYPAESADQAELIREKLRKSYEIVGTVLPAAQPDAPGRGVVFGVSNLAEWLKAARST
jgi:hypothetical protein